MNNIIFSILLVICGLFVGVIIMIILNYVKGIGTSKKAVKAIEDAKRKAEQIIQEANREAEQIKREARGEADNIISNAKIREK